MDGLLEKQTSKTSEIKENILKTNNIKRIYRFSSTEMCQFKKYPLFGCNNLYSLNFYITNVLFIVFQNSSHLVGNI